jgi:hypothetical protein
MIKKRLEDLFFRWRMTRARRDFILLRASLEKQNLSRREKRRIFKGFLRAAGFVGIRMREKK